MARLSRFAVAALTSACAILLLAFGTHYLHLWVGGHLSVSDFIVKSFIFLPVALGLVAALLPSPKLNRATLTAGVTGAAIGLAYGYLAPRVMFWKVFGDWQAAQIFVHPIGWSVEFPALVCAAVAGACAIVLSITSRGRSAIATIAIILIIAVVVPGPAYDLLTRNQELTIAIVTPQGANAAANPPEVIADVYSTPLNVGNMNSRVLQTLSEAGITGNYQVADLYRQGHGKQVLAIVVVSQTVVNKAELQEPDGENAIYVQESSGWKRIPSQVNALDRYFSLQAPLPGGDSFALVKVDGAGGEGAGFEVWKNIN